MAFPPRVATIGVMGAAVWTMLLVVLGPLLGWACGKCRPPVGVVLLGPCLALAVWPIANDWAQASVGWPWLIALLLLHLLLVLVPYRLARWARGSHTRTGSAAHRR